MSKTPEQKVRWHIIRNLPVRMKQLLYLHDYEKLNAKDIGEVLSIPAESVRRRVDNCRALIDQRVRLYLDRARTRLKATESELTLVEGELDAALLRGDIAKAANAGRKKDVLEWRVERIRQIVDALEAWG